MATGAAPAYEFRHRFSLVPAVYAILVRDGQVLLSRRLNTGFADGQLTVPSGHLEGDEQIGDAAARELREETGLEIDPSDVCVVGVMHRRTGQPGHERVDFFATVPRWLGEPRNLEPAKCAELGYWPLDDLPVDVVPYVRRALDRFRADGYGWFESWGW